mmetsp:Transcript_31925/g.92035  ORF Transcript_31925/g.92035 Transcript_31925/m.92035 type:complete len:249 (+) Transcript_31925:577-1323(+)
MTHQDVLLGDITVDDTLLLQIQNDSQDVDQDRQALVQQHLRCEAVARVVLRVPPEHVGQAARRRLHQQVCLLRVFVAAEVAHDPFGEGQLLQHGDLVVSARVAGPHHLHRDLKFLLAGHRNRVHVAVLPVIDNAGVSIPEPARPILRHLRACGHAELLLGVFAQHAALLEDSPVRQLREEPRDGIPDFGQLALHDGARLTNAVLDGRHVGERPLRLRQLCPLRFLHFHRRQRPVAAVRRKPAILQLRR